MNDFTKFQMNNWLDMELPDGTPDNPTIAQNASHGRDFYVDMVCCVDVTQSMASKLDTVKNIIYQLYNRTIDGILRNMYRFYVLRQFRIKVIAFRDYGADGPKAMEESPFFTLPEEKDAFRRHLASLEAKGGGDVPESAMEAMALAMDSHWVQWSDPSKKPARNVVIVFTDAPAHPLEDSKHLNSEYYPQNMLGSYFEFYEAWCGPHPLGIERAPFHMDRSAERLVLFVPEEDYPWFDMSQEIDYAATVPIEFIEKDPEDCLETIIKTFC